MLGPVFFCFGTEGFLGIGPELGKPCRSPSGPFMIAAQRQEAPSPYANHSCYSRGPGGADSRGVPRMSPEAGVVVAPEPGHGAGPFEDTDGIDEDLMKRGPGKTSGAPRRRGAEAAGRTSCPCGYQWQARSDQSSRPSKTCVACGALLRRVNTAWLVSVRTSPHVCAGLGVSRSCRARAQVAKGV